MWGGVRGGEGGGEREREGEIGSGGGGGGGEREKIIIVKLSTNTSLVKLAPMRTWVLVPRYASRLRKLLNRLLLWWGCVRVLLCLIK